jgi:surface polysaccharide O-acyltransferase-like enzyme
MTNRNRALDGAKTAAALGIVLLHVANVAQGSSPRLWYPGLLVQLSNGALFLFFVVAGYLHGPLGTRGRDWLVQRFGRLSIPYAFWSVVALGISTIAAIALGRQPPLPSVWKILFFAGAKDVLWSLPMLFYAAVVVELLVRSDAARRALIVCAAATMVIVFAVFPQSAWPVDTLRYYVLAPRWLMLYLLGMELRADRRVHSLPAGLFATAVAAGLAYVGVTTLLPSAAAMNPALALTLFSTANAVVALGTVGLAVRCPDQTMLSRLAWGGPLLLGVYVTHYFWLEAWVIVSGQGVGHTAAWIVAGWIVCGSLAIATTAGFMKVPALRRTVS